MASENKSLVGILKDHEFPKYRQAFLHMLSKKTLEEIRGIRAFLIALLKMNLHEIQTLAEDIFFMEERKTSEVDKDKKEFDRIIKGGGF